MGQMAFKGITKIGAQSSGVRGTYVVSFHSDKNVLVFGLQVLQSNKCTTTWKNEIDGDWDMYECMAYLKVWRSRSVVATSVYGPFDLQMRCGNSVFWTASWSSTAALNHKALMQEKPVFGLSLRPYQNT
nr:hypothetical protein Iba_chr12bCG9230 [Ipomoea batatas]